MTRIQADLVPPLVAWLAGRSVMGAEVRTNVPKEWEPTDGPLLIVADDAGPVRWPIKSRHTIRLTGYAAGRTEARRIVTTAAGELGAGHPTEITHVDSEMGGVLDARDPDTGAMLASVLVTMHARMVDA